MSDDEEVVDLTAAPASLGVPSDRYKAASHAAQHGYKRPTVASSSASFARASAPAAGMNNATPKPVKTETGRPTAPSDIRPRMPLGRSNDNVSSAPKKPMPFQMYENVPKKEKATPSPSPTGGEEPTVTGTNHFNERLQYGEVDEALADDTGGYCEVFNEYKCNSIPYGVLHPGHIVEGCVLASVKLPAHTYPLREALPSEIIAGGKLSQLQLEGVLYACQRHLVMLPWRMPLRWDAPVITPDCFNEGQGPAQKKCSESPTAAEGRATPGVKSEAGDDDDVKEELTAADKKEIEKTIAKVEKITADQTERTDKTVQLANGETVTTAGFTRAAFFIGDGAGVGKGRQIAGIIAANYARGRTKAVWVSTSADLRMDAERDLRDLGCPIKVINGTKDLTSHTMANGQLRKDFRQGVLFVTYHTLSRPDRMCEILNWCGGVNYEGVLVFDESHKAKNLDMGVSDKRGNKSSKMSVAVLTIQRAMPLSRVVYCSATGVTDLRHLAFMERLGLWGPGTAFDNFYAFHSDIIRRGIGALEMVSMSLKENGVYVSRGLSFQSCQFDVVYANVDEKMQKCYDECADFWRQLLLGLKYAMGNLNTLKPKTVYSQYWGTAQRFFLQLSIASKVKTVVEEANKALDDGHCVVIGLQATGEAALDYAELTAAGEMDDFVSHTRESVRKYIEKFFPDCELVTDPVTGERRERVHYPSRLKKEALLKRLDEIELPPTPLDHIIDELGGPEIVAEMTGRRGRLVRNYRNKVVLEYRGQGEGDIENLNIRETERFQRGERLVAVISDAASTGISLHASSRAMNQKRRIHITLELPWAADKAIQQLGRSHRTDQVSAPYYKLVVSDLPGERRCAVSVSARLESLGALTRGDRRAAHAMDLSSFNLDTKYGKDALELVLNSILAEKELLKDVDEKALEKNFNDAFEGTKTYNPFNYLDALRECLRYMDSIETGSSLEAPEKEYARIKKKNKKMKIKTFLNRLLMMPVKYQHLFYGYFILAFDAVIAKAKREGSYTEGIADISGTKVELVRTRELYQHTSGLVTKHLSIQTDRGMSFEDAAKHLEEHGSTRVPPECRDGLPDGFYITRDVYNTVGHKEYVLLAIRRKDKIRHFDIYRPNTGRSSHTLEVYNLESKYRPVKPEQVKNKWTVKYESSTRVCDHGAGCKVGRGCDHGKRVVKHEVVTGGLLPLWGDIDIAYNLFQGSDKKAAQIVRVAFENGQRAVGLKLALPIINMLEEDWRAKMESAWRIESDAVYQESEAPVCEEAYNALATGQAPKTKKRKPHAEAADGEGGDDHHMAKRLARRLCS